MRARHEIEVLAPAGSMECLKAAIKNGADAIYLGGDKFGARAYAGNFSQEELLEALDYAHLFGRKIFLTVNTLVKEDEMNQLVPYLIPYYENGLDGVIVQDLGVVSVIRKHFPKMEIHASTQMTVTSVESAKIAKELGAVRVVPARELSIEEIKAIKEETKLDVECFVHGALCYSYSGQCLMSSMIGGRSGNRGRCAGTCRLPFSLGKKSTHPFSMKDLCALEVLPALLDAGVDSLKIEGRMKGPRYVGEVTRIYCKYVDLYCSGKSYQVEQEDIDILMELFHRGGFTKGYFHQYNGKDMMSMKTPGNEGVFVGKIENLNQGKLTFTTIKDIHKGDGLRISISKDEYVELTTPLDWKKNSTITLNTAKMRKLHKGMPIYRMQNAKLFEDIDERLSEKMQEKLKGKVQLYKDKNAILSIDNGVYCVEATGATIEEAKSQGASKEAVLTLLQKTGTTSYSFDELEVLMDDNVFVPGSILKGLRKEAFCKLDEEKRKNYRRIYEPIEDINSQQCEEDVWDTPQVRASLENLSVLDIVIEDANITRVYLPATEVSSEDLLMKIKNANKQCFLILPRIARKGQMTWIEEHKDLIFSQHVDGLLVRNLEEIYWIRNNGYDKLLVLDFMLYGYNKEARRVYKQLMDREIEFVYPLECNENELMELDSHDELFFYGHVPLMVSSQCSNSNLSVCDKRQQVLTLTDRYQKKFYVKNDCSQCMNTVYNGTAIWLGSEDGLFDRVRPKAIGLHFTIESEEEVREVLQAVNEVQKGKKAFLNVEVTKGHLKRGVE